MKPVPSGGVCLKIKMGGAERKGVGLPMSTVTSARARAMHRGTQAGGEAGAPLGSPLHRDLGQTPETLQGTCQLSLPL